MVLFYKKIDLEFVGWALYKTDWGHTVVNYWHISLLLTMLLTRYARWIGWRQRNQAECAVLVSAWQNFTVYYLLHAFSWAKWCLLVVLKSSFRVGNLYFHFVPVLVFGELWHVLMHLINYEITRLKARTFMKSLLFLFFNKRFYDWCH